MSSIVKCIRSTIKAKNEGKEKLFPPERGVQQVQVWCIGRKFKYTSVSLIVEQEDINNTNREIFLQFMIAWKTTNLIYKGCNCNLAGKV